MKAADLVLGSIKANDLGKLALHGVVAGDKGILDLLDFVFLNGLLLLVADEVSLC